jgi:hypothetical protein
MTELWMVDRQKQRGAGPMTRGAWSETDRRVNECVQEYSKHTRKGRPVNRRSWISVVLTAAFAYFSVDLAEAVGRF